MWQELLDRFESLGEPGVLVVGDYMLDRYLFGDAERISPEAPVPILRIRDRQKRPGGAGSVAANLLTLGAQVACCGIIGDDAAGRELVALLGDLGADTSGLVVAKDRPTTEKIRLVGLAQHRHPQQVARIDAEDVSPLGDELVSKLLSGIRQALERVSIVCLQDHQKGVAAHGICQRIIELAQAAGKPVLTDPALARSYRKYTGVTCITPNRFETEEVLGRRLATEEDVAAAAVEMLEHCHAQAIVITLDKEGAYLAEQGGFQGPVPTTPQPVVDGTGAGDVVLASLALTAGAGWPWLQAVQLANVAGGIEVRKFGAVPLSRLEIIDEIMTQMRREGGKVRSMADLQVELRRRREQGQRIVFTNGCFDILHRGHVTLLEQARKQGDVLVVGLNSDASVRAQGKGNGRPVNRQDDRAAVLAGLESVDYVVIFEDPDPLACITSVCPDVLVKGKDWQDKGVIGREFVEARGGKVVLADLLEGYSTTGIVNRLAGREGP